MIKPLTSLRFLFALMVFAAHCYVIDPHFSYFLYKEGFVGVEFFFVLSGFIIAYNYQQKFKEKKISRRAFWVARFARVYPLHILSLLLLLAIGGHLVAINWDIVLIFFSQLFLVQPFIPDQTFYFGFDSPSWSLGCEQLFYALFPFLALWLRNTRPLFASLLILGSLLSIGMYFTPIEAIRDYWYVNPFTRLPDFLVGMLLFQFFQQISTNEISPTKATLLEIGAILVFLAFYYLGASNFIPKVYRYSIYYWIPIAGIIAVFALNKGAISRLLSHKYLVIGGDISYALYLLHLVVFKLYRVLDWHYPWPIVVPTLLCITIGLSLISYYYFERPVNRYLRNRFAEREVKRSY